MHPDEIEEKEVLEEDVVEEAEEEEGVETNAVIEVDTARDRATLRRRSGGGGRLFRASDESGGR